MDWLSSLVTAVSTNPIVGYLILAILILVTIILFLGLCKMVLSFFSNENKRLLTELHVMNENLTKANWNTRALVVQSKTMLDQVNVMLEQEKQRLEMAQSADASTNAQMKSVTEAYQEVKANSNNLADRILGSVPALVWQTGEGREVILGIRRLNGAYHVEQREEIDK